MTEENGNSYSFFSKILNKIKKHWLFSIVFLALLLDNVLTSIVVPIIPDYLGNFDLTLNVTAFNNFSLYQINQSWPSTADTPVGWLFSSKAIIQLFFNFIAGHFVNRFGYAIPLTISNIIFLTSCSLYAFGTQYIHLLLGRSMHGISSALVNVAGLSALANRYRHSEDERRLAMGSVMSAIAIGILIGYPLGGSMYEYTGKTFPFCVLLIAFLVQLIFQLITFYRNSRQDNNGFQFQITDSVFYYLITKGKNIILLCALLIPEIVVASIEPTLPRFFEQHLFAEKWQVGVAFMPDSFGFLAASLLANYSKKICHSILTPVSFITMAVCLVSASFSRQVAHFIIPQFGVGFALGVIDTVLVPLLALLVDQTHPLQYGAVFALGQTSIALGFAFGPTFGTYISDWLGFIWLLRILAIISFIYTPLTIFLPKPNLQLYNTLN